MQITRHIMAVGGIIQDENEDKLLAKTQHGGWVFPRDQIEVGENLMDTLVREFKEENGINIDVLRLIGFYSNN